MKRLAVLGTVATFAIASIAAVPRTAHAQLTMQMGNGWSLSFSGNVNAFEVEGFSSGVPADVTYGAVNSAEGTTNRVRTGLLRCPPAQSDRNRRNSDRQYHPRFPAPQPRTARASPRSRCYRPAARRSRRTNHRAAQRHSRAANGLRLLRPGHAGPRSARPHPGAVQDRAHHPRRHVSPDLSPRNRGRSAPLLIE